MLAHPIPSMSFSFCKRTERDWQCGRVWAGKNETPLVLDRYRFGSDSAVRPLEYGTIWMYTAGFGWHRTRPRQSTRHRITSRPVERGKGEWGGKKDELALEKNIVHMDWNVNGIIRCSYYHFEHILKVCTRFNSLYNYFYTIILDTARITSVFRDLGFEVV